MQTTLNPTQMHLLQLFSQNNSEAFAREIQEVLTRHFLQQSYFENEEDDQTMFQRYLENWKSQTQFLSSVPKITSHPAFKKIIDMGGNAVPLILNEIERQPSNLVWALNAILHKKTGEGMSVTQACKQWISELKKF